MHSDSPVLWVVVIVILLLLGAAIAYGISRRRSKEPPPRRLPPEAPLSKEDALQVMQLIECLHEIDQVK